MNAFGAKDYVMNGDNVGARVVETTRVRRDGHPDFAPPISQRGHPKMSVGRLRSTI